MKRSLIILALAGLITGAVGCSDFLDTAPKDALSPATTWKTPDDASKFLTGVYNNWLNGTKLVYLDCASDFGYNNFTWENYRPLGNGTMTASATGASFYGYNLIQRCNVFLDNIDKVTFVNEAVKNDMIAQVRTMRAFNYFDMLFWYGGVPIVKYFASADEAKVPRESEATVKQYVYDEIDAAINGGINNAPNARGYAAKGAALAIKMRSALYFGDYQRAIDAAQAIMGMNMYELDANYANVFTMAGQNSKEIILARQHIATIAGNGVIGQMYNNADDGWSSIVPTQNLVDAYEMSNGLTKEEAGSGYDATHPFKGRDPRMNMSVIFPGRVFNGTVVNTLDETIGEAKNTNYPTFTDNASKTSLTWAKYLEPKSQYANIWSTGFCAIAFRYAEVLLSFAEAKNELSGPAADVYAAINQVRNRAGMPDVDETKYATKETLRELIRRERGVEFAGEGLRRADILRWKDASGKMLAETLLDGPLYRITGTVNMDAAADPYTRATVTGTALIENRSFEPYMRYLPISQTNLTNNPALEQNPGY